jgi:hypothetical protein
MASLETGAGEDNVTPRAGKAPSTIRHPTATPNPTLRDSRMNDLSATTPVWRAPMHIS